MSPLWKSELRLRLGPGRCQAALWRGGLRPRCLALVDGANGDGDPVEAALNAIAAQGHDLPRRAMVLLEDELLYFAVMPARGSQRTGQAAARELLVEATGEAELLVEVSLLAGGRLRLAVAVNAATVDRVRGLLGARDVELRRVQAALPQDLASLPREPNTRDGVLALMRTEGMTLVGLRHGRVADVVWERCDLGHPRALLARIDGYRRRWGDETTRLPVRVVPADAAQHERMEAIVQARGWHLDAATPGML